jgi:hypothetical protein
MLSRGTAVVEHRRLYIDAPRPHAQADSLAGAVATSISRVVVGGAADGRLNSSNSSSTCRHYMMPTSQRNELPGLQVPEWRGSGRRRPYSGAPRQSESAHCTPATYRRVQPRSPKDSDPPAGPGPRQRVHFRAHLVHHQQRQRASSPAASDPSPALGGVTSGDVPGKTTRFPQPALTNGRASLAEATRAAVPEWRDIGASPQVLEWLRDGVKPSFWGGIPPQQFFLRGAQLSADH